MREGPATQSSPEAAPGQAGRSRHWWEIGWAVPSSRGATPGQVETAATGGLLEGGLEDGEGLGGEVLGIPLGNGEDLVFAEQFDADAGGAVDLAGVVGMDGDGTSAGHVLVLEDLAVAEDGDLDFAAVAADADDAVAISPGGDGDGDHGEGEEGNDDEPEQAEEVGVAEGEDADGEEEAADEEAEDEAEGGGGGGGGREGDFEELAAAGAGVGGGFDESVEGVGFGVGFGIGMGIGGGIGGPEDALHVGDEPILFVLTEGGAEAELAVLAADFDAVNRGVVLLGELLFLHPLEAGSLKGLALFPAEEGADHDDLPRLDEEEVLGEFGAEAVIEHPEADGPEGDGKGGEEPGLGIIGAACSDESTEGPEGDEGEPEGGEGEKAGGFAAGREFPGDGVGVQGAADDLRAGGGDVGIGGEGNGTVLDELGHAAHGPLGARATVVTGGASEDGLGALEGLAFPAFGTGRGAAGGGDGVDQLFEEAHAGGSGAFRRGRGKDGERGRSGHGWGRRFGRMREGCWWGGGVEQPTPRRGAATRGGEGLATQSSPEATPGQAGRSRHVGRYCGGDQNVPIGQGAGRRMWCSLESMEVEEVSEPVLTESLEGFLGKSRVAGVKFEWVNPKKVPEPYCGLLVHRQDMTSTLQRFHGEEIALEILRQGCEGEGSYFREVVLRGATSGKAVEYGVIEVVLPNFSPSMQAAILEGGQPLGGLLNETATEYGSSPLGYFAVPAAVAELFSANPGGEVLYGRYNQLLGEGGICLARIIEILPGVEES